ncbi:MAG: ribonuclease P protein component [Sphingobacteriales bacterium]|nr:ribonuclease P protein component [Sphingobacteriales bacterium]
MKKKFTLGKTERLKSRKQIEQLFNEGKKFVQAPFRILYLFSGNEISSLQFAAGVSNKNFKRAVDRNRIKRLIKEAYRLQKISLQQKLKEQKKSLNLFFIYTGKEMPEYKPVFDIVGKVLDKLIKQLIQAT